MTYSDDWLTVLQGDCREVMAGMEPESVHCVVTSPPYWGLRDYGTATWLGGDEGCDHKETVARHDGGRVGVDGFNGSARSDSDKGAMYRSPCRRCGAVRQDSQLGLEPTPEEYVANMVAVFREVRRVLRKDGTCWVNLGDSYSPDHSQKRNAGWKGEGPSGNAGFHSGITGSRARDQRGTVPGLKPKDLVGIPWRVAFALQADGWYLRSDIIWAKPNPMPEPVTDRPTKAHEYLFLLAKSARYYFDQEAVRENDQGRDAGNGFGRAHRISGGLANGNPEPWIAGGGRNLRSVWSIATQPYPGAHFATFPEKLVEPCIKAGCPPDGVVLDPFAGSGTVGRVAQRLSRRAVLIDLNADYLVQAMARNRDIPLGLETA